MQEDDIITDEIEEAIKKVNNGKAVGHNRITAGIVKKLAPTALSLLTFTLASGKIFKDGGNWHNNVYTQKRDAVERQLQKNQYAKQCSVGLRNNIKVLRLLKYVESQLEENQSRKALYL